MKYPLALALSLFLLAPLSPLAAIEVTVRGLYLEAAASCPYYLVSSNGDVSSPASHTPHADYLRVPPFADENDEEVWNYELIEGTQRTAIEFGLGTDWFGRMVALAIDDDNGYRQTNFQPFYGVGVTVDNDLLASGYSTPLMSALSGLFAIGRRSNDPRAAERFTLTRGTIPRTAASAWNSSPPDHKRDGSGCIPTRRG
jgi:hypothetical protein